MTSRPHVHYFTAYAVLLTLLGLTVAAARLHLGEWNLLIALLIAAIKTVVIAMFFMHLNRGSAVTRLFACAGLLWMALLIGLTISDVLMRPADHRRFSAETAVAASTCSHFAKSVCLVW